MPASESSLTPPEHPNVHNASPEYQIRREERLSMRSSCNTGALRLLGYRDKPRRAQYILEPDLKRAA